jgi:hypothetical protein
MEKSETLGTRSSGAKRPGSCQSHIIPSVTEVDAGSRPFYAGVVDEGAMRAGALRLASALVCVAFAGGCYPPQQDYDDAIRRVRLNEAKLAAALPPQRQEETMRVGDKTVRASEWKAVTATVRNVASFEMSCPADQLQFVILTSTPWSGVTLPPWTTPTQLGVTGCGQRRAYTSFNGKWASGGPTATDGTTGNP